MIEAAKSGSINMVVVKDFSRFGRDYLEVGRFLEYIFPILQIRFMSMNDGYDSSGRFGTTSGISENVFDAYEEDTAGSRDEIEEWIRGEWLLNWHFVKA